MRLEAVHIENETLKNELLKVFSGVEALVKKTQSVVSQKVLISTFFKMINFVTIILGFPQI